MKKGNQKILLSLLSRQRETHGKGNQKNPFSLTSRQRETRY
jgi:hypothetical protein